MTTSHVDVAPSLLRWAVARAGWVAETVTRRAPKFDDWVDGSARPTFRQIEKFAKDTHAPLGMLFLKEPPVEEVPIPDMRTLGNEQLSQPSAGLLDTIYLCQEHQDWYRDYALEQGAEKLPFIGSASVSSAPERIAHQIRKTLQFEPADRAAIPTWEESLRQLIIRIEDLGVLVKVSGIVGSNTQRRLKADEFRGFVLADDIAPLIFVNGTDTKAGQIFTLIHEFAHLFLGESALSDSAFAKPSASSHELWCNKVAAEVLVPRTLLSADFNGTVTTEELKRLARRYKVSTLVVLKSIFDAGFLTWEEYDVFYREEFKRIMDLMATRKSESGGNYYYTQPIRLSRQFTQAVLSSTLQGGTTFLDAYQMLGTRKHETFMGLAEHLGVA